MMHTPWLAFVCASQIGKCQVTPRRLDRSELKEKLYDAEYMARSWLAEASPLGEDT